MSTYICNICNYETDRYNNFTRHIKSKLHLKKCIRKDEEKNTEIQIDNNNLGIISEILSKVGSSQTVHLIINNNNEKSNTVNKNSNSINKGDKIKGVYVCKFCGLKFLDRLKKFRHQQKCECNTNIGKSDTRDVVKDNTTKNNGKSKFDNLTRNQLCELLQNKEEQIDKLLESNVNATKTSANATKTSANVSESTNKSVSAITYAMKYFKDAPVLKELEQSQVKELINYKGTLQSIEDIEDYIKQLRKQYNGDDIIEYFSKLIGSYLGVNVPIRKRRIWATDSSRLSFIIMQYVNKGKEKEWITDRTGKKFIDLVIDPMLKYIEELLGKYLELERKNQQKHYDSFYENQIKCEAIMELREFCINFRLEIQTINFKNRILKFVAPYFNFTFPRTKEPDYKEIGNKFGNHLTDSDDKQEVKPKKRIIKKKQSSDLSCKSIDLKPKKIVRKK